MNYAVMICTHGRPNAQHTLKTLRDCGYTGKIILIVDDEDDTLPELMMKTFGEAEIVEFNKQMWIDTSDTGTNENQRKCILYAKNFCEDLAKDRQLDAFVIADDDIFNLRYRYPEDGKLKSLKITKDMDKVIEAYVEYMLSADIVATGFGFTQFYFSGENSFSPENFLKYRVPYNFVFRNAKYKIDWMSWFGEDIITAVMYNKRGYFMQDFPFVQQEIKPLAKEAGGMKDTYDNNSDIRLAMQNIMYLPSELKAFKYRGKYMASIKRDKAFPMLISSSYKKSC
jgi:hypothetical protein